MARRVVLSAGMMLAYNTRKKDILLSAMLIYSTACMVQQTNFRGGSECDTHQTAAMAARVSNLIPGNSVSAHLNPNGPTYIAKHITSCTYSSRKYMTTYVISGLAEHAQDRNHVVAVIVFVIGRSFH